MGAGKSYIDMSTVDEQVSDPIQTHALGMKNTFFIKHAGVTLASMILRCPKHRLQLVLLLEWWQREGASSRCGICSGTSTCFKSSQESFPLPMSSSASGGCSGSKTSSAIHKLRSHPSVPPRLQCQGQRSLLLTAPSSSSALETRASSRRQLQPSLRWGRRASSWGQLGPEPG